MTSGPLFVYGSLTFDAVLREVLDRVPASLPAVVPGWRAVALRDRPFPGLIPAPADVGGGTRGRVITGLSPAEQAMIRRFEGPFYAPVRVLTATGLIASAYTLSDPALALDETWDRDRFARQDLPSYIVRCRFWRECADRAGVVSEQAGAVSEQTEAGREKGSETC